jgi:hypothetical protein
MATIRPYLPDHHISPCLLAAGPNGRQQFGEPAADVEHAQGRPALWDRQISSSELSLVLENGLPRDLINTPAGGD